MFHQFNEADVILIGGEREWQSLNIPYLKDDT
jgi:hypothetical protein